MLDNLSKGNKSGKKCAPSHRNPAMMQIQMRENLAECFKFMKAENIKLVNIGKKLDSVWRVLDDLP